MNNMAQPGAQQVLVVQKMARYLLEVVSGEFAARRLGLTDEGWTRYRTATEHFKSGNFNAGLDEFEAVTKMDNVAEGAYLGLALCNHKLGHMKVAGIYGNQAAVLNEYLAPQKHPDLYQSYLAVIK